MRTQYWDQFTGEVHSVITKSPQLLKNQTRQARPAYLGSGSKEGSASRTTLHQPGEQGVVVSCILHSKWVQEGRSEIHCSWGGKKNVWLWLTRKSGFQGFQVPAAGCGAGRLPRPLLHLSDTCSEAEGAWKENWSCTMLQVIPLERSTNNRQSVPGMCRQVGASSLASAGGLCSPVDLWCSYWWKDSWSRTLNVNPSSPVNSLKVRKSQCVLDKWDLISVDLLPLILRETSNSRWWNLMRAVSWSSH